MRASLFAALLLVACGSTPEPAPPPSAAPAPSPPPAPSPAPTPSTTPSPTTTALAPLTADQRAQLTAAIRAGREAAHQGHFAEALTSFETAVALSPSSSRVRCEAAYVAFQAGDVARAEAHLRIAVAGLPQGDVIAPRLRVPTATCLYNAGLVYEARDRLDDARAAFTRSIALRPNRTVQARLDALAARLASADDDDDEDDDDDFGPYTSAQTFEAIAADVGRILCERGSAGMSADDPAGAAMTPVITRVHAEGTVPIDAALLAFDAVVSDSGGEQTWDALVVRAGDRVLVGELSEVYSAGMFGMVAVAEATIEARDVLVGGAPEILVSARADAGDSDMGSCDHYDSRIAATILCSTDSGALRCVALPTEQIDTYDHDSCADSTDDGGDDAPTETDAEVHEAHGYSLTLRLDAGHAVFGRAPDARGEAVPPIMGDQPIGTLLDRADLAWPSAWTPLAPVSG